MINYSILMIDGKVINSYLNLNKDEFLEILWRWTYTDVLFEIITERNFSQEELENYLIENFIPEEVFHNYEDDDLTCFAFTASDEKLEVKEFDNYEMLLPFIMNKITENYENVTIFRVKANSMEEAEDFVSNGDYDEVVQDSEIGEMEDPDVLDIVKV